MNPARILGRHVLGTALLFSAGTLADDIEIYFGSAGGASDGSHRPNVLFILDTSSSMDSTDSTNPPVTRLQRMKDALKQVILDANNINLGLQRFHTQGGPILFPVSYIDADADAIEGTGSGSLPSGSVQSRVGQSSDDAEQASSGTVRLTDANLEMTEIATAGGSEYVAIPVSAGADDVEEQNPVNTNLYPNSTDLEFMYDGSTLQKIGVRFQNVTIPNGATITDAYIRFTEKNNESNSTAINIDIYGHNTGDAPAFANGSGTNVSGRAKTSAKVDWNNPPNVSSNNPVNTPNLTNIVQEIVNRGDWASGNSMAFLFERDSGSGMRRFWSYEGTSTTVTNQSICGGAYTGVTLSRRPTLVVCYNTSPVNDQQTVGYRFQNVGVPQGATVTSAVLEFTASNTNTAAANLTIRGEAADNSASFTATPNDLTARPTTAQSVVWNADPWGTQNTTYQSPDLTAVVQEIVNRPGWCGGNAMSFLVTGTGTRTAWSYDGDTNKAAMLRITYQTDPEPTGCNVKTVQKPVKISSDDAEEFQNGAMSLNDTDLELVYDGATNGNQDIGIRFQNVDIPKNATIQSAYIEFTAKGSSSTGSTLTIHGEASDFAQTFQIYAGNVSGRPKTAASVNWTGIPAWSDGQKYQTPSLVPIVQEIVNRDGWEPYNGMAFIISGTTTVRRAWSHDGNADYVPVLKVTYTGGTGGVVKTVRQRLIEIIDELEIKSGTPIVDSLAEAVLYFQGKAVCFGKTRGFNNVSGGEGCSPASYETSTADSEFTRVSHPASWTGGTLYRPAGCNDTTINTTACLNEAIQGSPVYKSPITTNCQANYFVLLSDGEPNHLHSETMVEALSGGQNCSSSNGGESCAFNLVEYIHTHDNVPNNTATCDTCATGDQTITTYTIGFAVDGDPAYLQTIAQRGGGSFYTADDTQGLVDAFQSILSEILAVPASFTAPALSVNAFNKQFNLNEIYLALFKPSSARGWAGNVKKYLICDQASCGTDGATFGDILDADGNKAIGAGDKLDDDARSLWSDSTDGSEVESGGAASNLPGYATRANNLYTYIGSTNFPASPVTLATGADTPYRIKTGNTSLTQAMLGATSDAERTSIIEWMQGKDVNDDNNNGITDENRPGIFADPLHSRPIVVTYGQDASDTPVQKLIVGTNDGALHFLNPQGNASNPNPASGGQEQWAYYPPAALDATNPIQKALYTGEGGSPDRKIYGVDGTPTALIIDRDSDGVIEPTGDSNTSDHVYVFFGMRDGGRDINALELTPSSTLTDPASVNDITPKFLWRIAGGTNSGPDVPPDCVPNDARYACKKYDYTGLGYTWSAPLPAKIRMTESGITVSKNVLIFGGGYDGNSQEENDSGDPIGTTSVGNGLYIVEAVTGKRILWVSSDTSTADPDLKVPDMNYAIPGDVKLYDSDGDGYTDRLYFSDTGGQIWRMDLATNIQAGDPGDSRAARLASFSDLEAPYADADKRRLYTRVEVTPVRDTYFSSATNGGNLVTDYDVITIVSGYMEHPLDLTITDRVYAVRDYLIQANFPDGYRITTDSSGAPTNYPKCISSGELGNTCAGSPLTEANLVDTTDNVIQTGNEGEQANAKAAFGASEGWYIVLREPDGSLIGEKGLSPTTVINGILFFTTYIPSQDAAAEGSCTGGEGTGRLWAVDILSGAAVFPDFDGDASDLDTQDRYQTIGSGIPTEVVPVVLAPGITTLVGTSSGVSSGPTLTNNPVPTHWYQN